MPRDLSPALAALLASGNCKSHDTVGVTLGDATQFYLATASVVVDGRPYLPTIEEVAPLQLGLTPAVDKATFKVQNVDLVMGQAVTGQTNAMDGAEAVLGIVFVDLESGATYYDERMPGQIAGNEVVEKSVTFNVISDISAAQIGGRLISDVFPFSDVPVSAPIALTQVHSGSGDSGDIGGTPSFGGNGRYPIMDSIV